MTPAIALLVIGFILVKAGWSGQSIVDVALGRTPAPATDNVQGDAKVAGETGVTSLQGGLSAPAGTTMIDGHPVANWIAPTVLSARKTGIWHGVVTSGYRTLAEQTGLWNNRASNPNPVAPPGESEHGKLVFPGGAVDVSDPDDFQRALNKIPGGIFLKRDPRIGDPVHFSYSGR